MLRLLFDMLTIRSELEVIKRKAEEAHELAEKAYAPVKKAEAGAKKFDHKKSSVPPGSLTWEEFIVMIEPLITLLEPLWGPASKHVVTPAWKTLSAWNTEFWEAVDQYVGWQGVWLLFILDKVVRYAVEGVPNDLNGVGPPF